MTAFGAVSLAVEALKNGAVDFVTIIPRIAIGVIGSGYIAAIVPPQLMSPTRSLRAR